MTVLFANTTRQFGDEGAVLTYDDPACGLSPNMKGINGDERDTVRSVVEGRQYWKRRGTFEDTNACPRNRD